MKVRINNVIQLAIALLLVFAAITSHGNNFYIFVRWTIFLLSIYAAYKVRKRPIIVIILISIIGLLFNPILPFTFHKNIWHIIDFVLAIILLMAIDLKGYTDTFSQKRKLTFNFSKTIFYLVIIWGVAVWIFFYPCAINFYEQSQLIIKKTTTVKGFITAAYDENVTESETQGTRYDFWFSYEFMTTDGKRISSSASEVGRIPEEFKDLSQNPYPIDIVYLNENPKINLPKDQMKDSLLDVLRTEYIFMGVFIFVIGVVVSFQIIRNATEKYLTETKKLLTTI